VNKETRLILKFLEYKATEDALRESPKTLEAFLLAKQYYFKCLFEMVMKDLNELVERLKQGADINEELLPLSKF